MKSIEADQIGHVPMLLLLSTEETTVEVLPATAFTWINKDFSVCGNFGGGKKVSHGTEESEPPKQASFPRCALLGIREATPKERQGTVRISVYGPGSSSQPEAAFKENGELGFRHSPLPWRHLPLFLHLPQDQEQQLERTLVGGKVPAGSHRPAQFGIERLDGIGGVDDPAHLVGKGKERDHRRPIASPG